MKNERGITMVEVLIIVAIIGLLATLAVMSLNNIRERSRDAKRVNDMNNLHTAMELVRDGSGGYDFSGCDAGAVSDCRDGVLATYLPVVQQMVDPSQSVDLCDASCSSRPCNYAFLSVPLTDDYEVKFYIEGAVGDVAAGCHSLTPRGIE